MPKSRMKEGRKVNVLYKNGDAARLSIDEADALVRHGKAHYLSNSLFKAVKAGLDINKMFPKSEQRRDDANIKMKIQLHLEKKEERRRKKEKEKKEHEKGQEKE